MKKRILPIIIIFAVILLAGVSVFLGNKLLTTRNESVSPAAPESKPGAYTGQIRTTDSCGKVKIEVVESPNCPKLSQTGNNTCPVTVGAKNEVTSYQTTYKVTSNDGQAHTIVYRTSSNFCNSACGTYYDSFGGIFSCSEPLVPGGSGTEAVPYNIVIQANSPSGAACGTYQQDIWIDSVDGNASCNFKTADGNVGAWGMCQTGVTCPNATTTPTSPAEPTPVAGQHCAPLQWTLTGATPTPTATPTATPAPTATPKSCNLSCDEARGNTDCAAGLVCSGEMCRNPECLGETDCTCPGTTPTPTPKACNLSCDANADCAAGLVCSGSMCRKPECTGETDCTCPTAARPTPTPVGPSLPNAGFEAPTIMGIGGGLLLVVTAILLAL